MRPTWIPIYVGSVLIGLAAWWVSPERWKLEPTLALFLGSALYFGALHRYVRRLAENGAPVRWGGLLLGVTLRAAMFLALVALQAYLCFEVAPDADVRGGFVLAATWLVTQGLIDPRRPAEN